MYTVTLKFSILAIFFFDGNSFRKNHNFHSLTKQPLLFCNRLMLLGMDNRHSELPALHYVVLNSPAFTVIQFVVIYQLFWC